jgi:hypothetical protein
MHLYPARYKSFSEVLKKSKLTSWKDRVEKALWRGSTTGDFYLSQGEYVRYERWEDLPRSKLVMFSKRHPELLDCSFSQVVQQPDSVQQIIKNRGLMEKGLSPKSQLHHKYLIAIDGNTCASSLKWQLFSGSVVFKNDSDWMEWYDTALIPYKHYVPFKLDASDLIDRINWVKQNDKIGKKIADEALQFALKNFTEEGVDQYIYKLIAAYSKLLTH